MVNNKRGLSAIPVKVESALPNRTINILKNKGHGLSFPEDSGCQMRIIRDGVDYGGFYSYNLYGGIRKAVNAAMSRHNQIRIAMPLNQSRAAKRIYFVERFDKRKGKTEYRYAIYYRGSEGKIKQKCFSFGHTQPSPDKQFHGYRTAQLFLSHFDEFGNSMDFAFFKVWKEVRLYESDRGHFDWKNT